MEPSSKVLVEPRRGALDQIALVLEPRRLGDRPAPQSYELWHAQVTLSPDASKVAWAEAIFDKGRDTGRTAVMWMPTDGKSKPARLGEGAAIAWAHDSHRIAWVDKQLDIATIGGWTRSSRIGPGLGAVCAAAVLTENARPRSAGFTRRRSRNARERGAT